MRCSTNAVRWLFSLFLVVAAVGPWASRIASGQTLIGTIPVGFAPLGVAANSTTNRIYVANENGDTVSVIDGTSDTTLPDILVPGSPKQVAVNPLTNRIYATVEAGFLRVIDGASGTIVTSVPLPVSFGDAVAVNPTTNRVYVSSLSTTTPSAPALTVVDGSDGGVLASLSLNSFTFGVTVNSATNRVYVAAAAGIVTLDGATNAVLSTLPPPAGFQPREVALNPATGRLYVTNGLGPGLLVVDTSNNTIVAAISGVGGVTGVAVNETINHVYTPGLVSGLAVIDGATNSVIANVDLEGATIFQMAANPVTNRVYASEVEQSRVFVIDDSPSGSVAFGGRQVMRQPRVTRQMAL